MNSALSTTNVQPALLVRSVPTTAAVASHYGNLDGKVFVITGASSGIGLECASSLARAHATVCMVCRGGAKADAAAEQVKAVANGGGTVHLLNCDIGSLASVKACADAFMALNLPLHGLINNAGINGVPEWGQMTPGVETQFMVNFIGHFYLSQLLHEKLLSTEGARIVNLASESHRRVLERGFDLKRQLPPPKAGYDCLHAYAFSNFCRILWTRELARRVPYPVVCLHPSVVGGTGMLQHVSPCVFVRQVFVALWWELRPSNMLQSVEQGARAQTWCAVAPVDEVAKLSGTYLSGNLQDRRSGAWRGVEAPSKLASRDDLAREVYEFAAQFVANGPQSA